MLIAFLLAQITPVQPIVHGTALPPPGSEEAAVMAPVERMFAAMAARDAPALLAQLRPEGGATVVIEDGGRRVVSHRSWAEFAQALKPGQQHYEERLIGPAIEVDGDIALVWSPYVFTIDGKVHHCGTDHFDLVREGAAWRILNITWTQRTTGCPAQ